MFVRLDKIRTNTRFVTWNIILNFFLYESTISFKSRYTLNLCTILFLENYHRYKVLDFISTTQSKGYAECLNNEIKEYIHVSSKKGKGKSKKRKKEKKGKKKKAGEVGLKFSGELFITGMYMHLIVPRQ